ncbi:hypothetical protein HRH25_16685 [Flavisolibacter sp. BT320]|nr:hypothetical protein [Flavisolibacter longurius]
MLPVAWFIFFAWAGKESDCLQAIILLEIANGANLAMIRHETDNPRF